MNIPEPSPTFSKWTLSAWGWENLHARKAFSVILVSMQDPALVKDPGQHFQIDYNLLHGLE